jgi:hypothetical protein
LRRLDRLEVFGGVRSCKTILYMFERPRFAILTKQSIYFTDHYKSFLSQ